MDNFVITIARGFGSGGKKIGTILSKELGIPCYDNQFYNMLEDYSGLNRKMFASVDEKLRGPHLLRKLRNFPTSEYIVSPQDRDFVSDENLYKIQVRLIKELIREQSCIIIGKCANHVLKDSKNVLSIYIEAPRDVCVTNTVEKMGVTEEEANRLISKTDKYRAEYFKYYSGGKKWTDPVLYDMTINTGRIKREESVALIKEALRIKKLI